MVHTCRSALVLICLLSLPCSILTLNPGFNASSPAFAAEESTNESAIAVKSISTRYDDEFESFHVFGELENNLKTPIEDLRLNVTFYDSHGNLTGSIYSSPYFSSLRPGEKSAFDLVAQGASASQLMDFSYYKISRTWEKAKTEKEDLLRLDVRQISVDPCGYYRFEGLANNLANEHTSGLSISAAFYNEQNQIVETGFTTIEDRLDSTKSLPFSMTVEQRALPHFAYYSFNVQSDNYTSSSAIGGEDLSNFHSLVPKGGKIMTISTEQPVYSTDQDMISVKGQVPPEEVKKHDENSLALIKIVTASNSVPVLVTAPVAQDGTFSRQFEYQMDDGMIGQVFRIRAEYFGMIAESTFSVGNVSNGLEKNTCETFKIVGISELNALTGGPAGSTVTDYLSGRQIHRGSNVTLFAVIDNEVSRRQNVTVIFEIFDSEGHVEHIDVAEWQLDPNARNEIRTVWVPDHQGTFAIKSFAVSTLYNPVLLSTGTPLSIKVIR
ncbi:MAG TPA: FxLYD domain-containing protein [Nitrososphaera sp.]|nr:FxLYD domain-containing protein [Nitrososphaera sp.]